MYHAVSNTRQGRKHRQALQSLIPTVDSRQPIADCGSRSRSRFVRVCSTQAVAARRNSTLPIGALFDGVRPKWIQVVVAAAAVAAVVAILSTDRSNPRAEHEMLAFVRPSVRPSVRAVV